MLGNIQNQNLKRSKASNFGASIFGMPIPQNKSKDGDKEFDYNEYSKENHLDSLSEVNDFANEHHL